jgi:trans-L-3-hydroxyproline dehydratase
MTTVKTIDAHAEGAPLRLVTEGFPAPRGRTMFDKREWARRHVDHLRRWLMLEPRGHADMCGAVLTESVSPGSHAGILFMDNDGYGEVLGHGLIAAAAIALRRGLVLPGGDAATVVFDTTSGTIRAQILGGSARGHAEPGGEASALERAGGGAPAPVQESGSARGPADPSTGSGSSRAASTDEPGGERIRVFLPPSFVVHGGLVVGVGSRQIRADIAFGGVFHAIVDAEAAGLSLDAAHAPEIRRAGMQIRRAIEATLKIVHPFEPRLQGLHATLFTGPAHAPGADLRSVAVFADAAIDRSASVTGTAAILSVLDAIGLTGSDVPLVCEGVIGTRLRGRVAGRASLGDSDAIAVEIEGSAHVVGEHVFFVDDADPLAQGFRV